MFCKLPLLATLAPATLFLAASVAAANSTFAIIGFGTGIGGADGAPFFYGDGVAYIGSGSTASLTEASNITFTSASSLGFTFTDPFEVVSSTLTFSAPQYLAVNTTAVNGAVAFIPADAAVDGLTITGFGFFEDHLIWENVTTQKARSGWWAEPTGVEDLWTVNFVPLGDSAGTGAVSLSVEYQTV